MSSLVICAESDGGRDDTRHIACHVYKVVSIEALCRGGRQAAARQQTSIQGDKAVSYCVWCVRLRPRRSPSCCACLYRIIFQTYPNAPRKHTCGCNSCVSHINFTGKWCHKAATQLSGRSLGCASRVRNSWSAWITPACATQPQKERKTLHVPVPGDRGCTSV